MEILDSSIAAEVADQLLQIQAIRLQPEKPFTWASGWKSPIYCDNRLSLSFPAVRDLIKENLVKSIQHFYPEAEAIAGVATAGIPQGALIANDLKLPFIYVRSKPKGHGMENMIEGKVTPGQKVVVVEDLVSTGGSSLKAVQDLKNAGFEVMGMVAIFSYGFSVADDNFEEAGIKLVVLSNYEAMLPRAVEKKYISDEVLKSLETWRKDPANWTP
ncbi:MAG TPA: orotate phosphoribosyltransferase [Algoriphagus sp.]|jgi:orotate phosphoribosyltransferase|uniref:Orotate phosphoribosyltransferase n=1 Tax=Algoriphagus ornithinivorans TaxID=226506 RepID=A0A1I5IW53_9BACT|nr:MULTISPECIES: orotate phosphoribosyltransferase [Algoriphagus]MAL12855.1 orotate phosphoribosyltransferase [Algoriphagus sp.]QYH39132.1 orotate phosphoribosyltransferase [Algoriphagus sp. NBT04N3]SFO64747.1 orotate phosphoribosyltransferase [Algoriphagus ornithinivorans]HAD52835.1 orotate phosphoribosyltransferase [Algoriphagus sp.]HAH35936.1 orotate phosphoribosyltransferase [Algoriphagus sp.]|tara:strand:- start:6374 stop:7018 length:645 start_codon:yes stop_codon:yes gene_type:complete